MKTDNPGKIVKIIIFMIASLIIMKSGYQGWGGEGRGNEGGRKLFVSYIA